VSLSRARRRAPLTRTLSLAHEAPPHRAPPTLAPSIGESVGLIRPPSAVDWCGSLSRGSAGWRLGRSVGLAMPVVWSDRCRLHDPGSEIFVGVRMPGTEWPHVQTRSLLRSSKLMRVSSAPCSTPTWHCLPCTMRHSWSSSSPPGTNGLVRGSSERGPGPRRALRVRPRGADVRPAGGRAHRRLGKGRLLRVRHDYPHRARYLEHHVCRACYGGSCYLNHSAVAAAAFADKLAGPVAVLDIDAHHGNGTQEIFYEHGDVLIGSVHVDPGAGCFPRSSASRTKRAPATATARTRTCRCHRAPATSSGSMQ
jgi:hypothetical protein